MKLPNFKLSTGLTLIIAPIIAIVSLVVYEAIQETVSKEILDSQLLQNLFIIVLFGIIVLISFQIKEKVDDLYKTRRLHIRYIPVDLDNGKELYQSCTKFVEEAKEHGNSEILAVNSFVEVFQESVDIAKNEYRTKYLEALKRKAKVADYHRIIQVRHNKSGFENFANLLSDSYRNHYSELIELRNNSKDTRTRIDVSPPLFPESFVVISNYKETSYLIWQINEHVPDKNNKDSLRLAGVFLITDPDEQVVKYFRNWFNQLISSRDLRPLLLSDIENGENKLGIEK